MNKRFIQLLCVLISMPLASHAMLRNVAGKISLAKVQLPSITASMATLSGAQRDLLEDRLKNLQNDWMKEDADIDVLSNGWVSGGPVYTGDCVRLAHSQNRKLMIEDKIFEVKFKLAEGKK